MQLDWIAIQKRLIQKDETGQFLMAVTGTETDDELRGIAERISFVCPANANSVACPFKMLSGLTPGSRQRTLALVDRKGLLELFKLEQECRNQAMQMPAPSRTATGFRAAA
jgi:hypothetical protein